MAKKQYHVEVNSAHCKGCELCVALCPRQVYIMNNHDKAEPANMAACIGCLTCVLHCPDFCIAVDAQAQNSDAAPKAATQNQTGGEA